MKILAIDPGNEQSAYVVYDTVTRLPIRFGILSNIEMKHWIYVNKSIYDNVYVEMIASYGMAVGKTVFETCVWIGIFAEAFGTSKTKFIYRKDVKMHLCGNTRAKDANIRQAIMDLYGSTRERAIGTKKNPGPLYGFKADMWAAMGVALTAAERYAVVV